LNDFIKNQKLNTGRRFYFGTKEYFFKKGQIIFHGRRGAKNISFTNGYASIQQKIYSACLTGYAQI